MAEKCERSEPSWILQAAILPGRWRAASAKRNAERLKIKEEDANQLTPPPEDLNDSPVDEMEMTEAQGIKLEPPEETMPGPACDETTRAQAAQRLKKAAWGKRQVVEFTRSLERPGPKARSRNQNTTVSEKPGEY